jgi:hypothetical protein
MSDHGSPEDRGSADAHYGRAPRPHRRDGWTDVPLTDPAEVAAYWRGYRGETERKDWGAEVEECDQSDDERDAA